MVKARDQQRSRVYNWQDEAVEGYYTPTMTLEESEQLVRKAITWWFRLKNTKNARPFTMPRVIRGRNGTAATGSSGTISLPPWAWSEGVVLHETAHCIVDRHNKRYKDGGHGPYFMRVFIELLGHYMKLNRPELTRSAKKSKIKVHTMAKLPRPKP